jgi:hypothetical protein
LGKEEREISETAFLRIGNRERRLGQVKPWGRRRGKFPRRRFSGSETGRGVGDRRIGGK